MGRAAVIKSTLEQEIVSGILTPGQQLDEPTLVRRFGVSRTPVREALNQLAAVGLIQMRLARSPVVARLTKAELESAFEVLAELETLCGKLAAQRATDAQVEALIALHADFAKHMANGSTDDCYQTDILFHELLGEMSCNPYLKQQQKMLRDRFGPFRRHHFERQGRLAKSHAEHADVLAAIKSRDPKRAATALRKHVNMHGDVFADFMIDIDNNTIKTTEESV